MSEAIFCCGFYILNPNLKRAKIKLFPGLSEETLCCRFYISNPIQKIQKQNHSQVCQERPCAADCALPANIFSLGGNCQQIEIIIIVVIIVVIIVTTMIVIITIVIILTITGIITKIKLENLNLKEETWWRRESVRAGIVCGENLGKKVSLFLSPTDQVAADDQHAQQVLEKGGKPKIKLCQKNNKRQLRPSGGR